MDSPLVIKVKYGDILRRFTAYIDENGLLDLDMAGLKLKIHSLFKVAPDADVTLTYIDEDKDEVTLVDDNDLCDATRQNLNPLRIDVVLNSVKARRSVSKLNKSSAPKESARIEHLSSHNDSTDQDPIFNVFSKLSHDLTIKATSLILTKLAECLSKLETSDLVPVSECQHGASLSGERSASDCSMCPKVTDDSELPKLNAVHPTLTDFQKALEIGCITKPVGNSIFPSTAPVVLNVDLPRDSSPSAYSSLNITDSASASDPIPHNNEELQKENVVNVTGNSMASGSSTSTTNVLPLVNLHPFQASQTPLPHNCGSCALNGDNIKKHPGEIEQSFASQENFSPGEPNLGFMPGVESPNYRFSGVVGCDALTSPYNVCSSNKSCTYSDSYSRVFHKGIRCDGCGVHPIMGPRFKSKVQENFDLCSICFSDLGNEAEYIRLDQPVSIQSSWLSKNFFDGPWFQPPSFIHASQGSGRKMFDSRFVCDLNVVDGTVVAPNVLFTKKWRMCNNGATAWPHRLQLVWIGGDQLTDRVSVEVEIPVDGVPVDKELDITVDFKAPERPGRYISYWRMSLPSGKTFGQKVWALIQVDASLLGSDVGFEGINLNDPPHTCMVEGEEINNVDAKPVDGRLPENGRYRVAAEGVNPKPAVDEEQNEDQNLDFPVNHDSIIGDGLSVPSIPTVSTPCFNSGVDLSMAPSEPSPVTDKSSGVVSVNDAFEQNLLEELKQMGFNLTDLNKEILRMNAYDLEQSVADLCTIDEDEILKDLA